MRTKSYGVRQTCVAVLSLLALWALTVGPAWADEPELLEDALPDEAAAAGWKTLYLDDPTVRVTGDVAYATAPCDPKVATWAQGNGPHGVIIGVDPCSSNPGAWDGARVIAVVRAPVAPGTPVRVKVGLIPRAWLCGKGIHSPNYGSTAVLRVTGTCYWFVCEEPSCNAFNSDYYAVEAQNIVVRGVAGKNGRVRLVFRVPPQTAWDISYVRVLW